MNDPTINNFTKQHEIEPCDWDEIDFSNNK